MTVEIQSLPPVRIAHQEGLVALIALVGLMVRDGSPVAALVPPRNLLACAAAGLAGGLLLAGAMLVLRGVPALGSLEAWQRRMVEGWSVTDAISVAVASGLAEEALARALLQPLIGLVPAAVLFAVLHLVPDRRLWVWPVMALLMGLALGLLFEWGGWVAAAAAHVTVNLVGLLRLRGRSV
jgi:membrane protease YdiL (CAAX protease family)